MIIFISDGRLGNQIFQYVFLKTIAKENEMIITINMNEIFELFDIQNKNIKNIKVSKYIYFVLKKFIGPIFLNFLVKMKIITYIKQDRNEISALPSFKISRGILSITWVNTDFFQSEAFFDASKLDFHIKKEHIDKAKEFISKIDNKFTKVFVHVRRGDYLYEKFLTQIGINLPKTYYLKAINLIESEIENPFYIFISDDPEYVECCFSGIINKIVSSNDKYTDFVIMTLCEAGICSNSSFSWWGSYLMQNRKLIIMPKYWYGWKQQIESHIGIQPKWAVVIDF